MRVRFSLTYSCFGSNLSDPMGEDRNLDAFSYILADVALIPLANPGASLAGPSASGCAA
jgi:hypothetical protein